MTRRPLLVAGAAALVLGLGWILAAPDDSPSPLAAGLTPSREKPAAENPGESLPRAPRSATAESALASERVAIAPPTPEADVAWELPSERMAAWDPALVLAEPFPGEPPPTPPVPGTLELWLPYGAGARPGEAVQYVIDRIEPAKGTAIVETVRGNDPQRDRRGVKTTADSLRIAEILPGRYSVEARSLVHRQDGRWIPGDFRWRGEASIQPGLLTRATLR